MLTQTLFQTALLLHLLGISLFAGSTVIEFVTFNQFWKQYRTDAAKGQVLLEAVGRYNRLLRTSVAVAVLAGIGMMALTHGIFGEQLWFRIKFGLFLVLVANALFVGTRHANRLRKRAGDTGYMATFIDKAKRKLDGYYLVQFVLLFAIILLSVFKFN